MLLSRIIGALTFRRETYEDVEQDTTFTRTAWIIVAVVSLLTRLTAGAPSIADSGVFAWLLGAALSAAVAVVAFGVAAWAISMVGQGLFNAEVTFYEIVRTLGLAYVWAAFGVLGLIGLLSPSLRSLVFIILAIATVLTVIAWVYAAKRALDLSWGKTFITVLLGTIVFIAISELIVVALGGLGLQVPSLSGALAL